MGILDQALNMVTRKEKTPPVGSRSEREAKIKDRAGLVITIFALLLSINSWYGGKLSSTIMNGTLSAHNEWNRYQAKAGRGVAYELQALTTSDPVLKAKFTAESERMDADKAELAQKARAMEALRDEAKQSSPWISYASTAYQLAIVVLSASILAVSMPMFFGSFLVAGIGILLSAQGVFLLW
jgi:hypothetical protein